MGTLSEKRRDIESFIQANIREHSKDITRLTQEKFHLSKPAVMNYINRLIAEKKLEVTGITKNREYNPLPIVEKTRVYPINPETEEGTVWKDFSNLLGDIKENIRRICQYGFAEIVNNAIEHSEGKELLIQVTRYFDEVEIVINDDGIGIFEKIQRKFGLDDPIHSILELSKGKLTTDPVKHTGEGIFFTSRVFDTFFIRSKRIGFLHSKSGFDYIDQSKNEVNGTSVMMEISLTSRRTLQKIFDNYSENDGEFGFDKTIVPVHLAMYGDDQLISRSQARRLLTRFEKFKTVVLDFKGVEMIGQAFADEIFRVFQTEHPEVLILSSDTNKTVEKMIQHVRAQ